MAISLNPFAAPFVPSHQGAYCAVEDDEASITSTELEELEALEEWVQLMAELEESEREHLISVALSQAPAERIIELELRHGGADAGKQQHPRQRRAPAGGKKAGVKSAAR